MGHHAKAAASGVCWKLAGNKPHGPPATELSVIGNDVWQVVAGPGTPDQASGLGQVDPDPHTGMGHKGTVVPHPGACVSHTAQKTHRMPLPKLVKTESCLGKENEMVRTCGLFVQLD